MSDTEDQIEKEELICNYCSKIIDEEYQSCDGCYLTLCPSCEDKSTFTFRHCDECNATWCYCYELYTDYPCKEFRHYCNGE